MRHALITGGTLLGLVACTARDKPAADAGMAGAATTPNVVTIVARDFTFSGPDTFPSGLTTIRLVTEDKNLHHAQFVRLHDGKTVADLQEALKSPGPLPSWATDAGGPNPPAPGDTAAATLMMEPGKYALVCFVDTPDRVPHFVKGMIHAVTVVPSTGPAAAEPVHDLALTLKDYSFEFSEPPTAGKHTILIDNGATQSHEMVLVAFLPGKSMDDLMQWAATYEGPAPAKPLGGTAGIAPGMRTFITVDLPPGDYAMLCFVPDATSRKPHIAHGMVKTFTVS